MGLISHCPASFHSNYIHIIYPYTQSRIANFKLCTLPSSQIAASGSPIGLHLQPELITAFFLRHTSARGERVHGNLIPPPSLWPGRELRKYHYCPWRIIAHTVADRIYVLLDLACQTKWIAACHQRNERAPLYDFQGSLKMGLPS